MNTAMAHQSLIITAYDAAWPELAGLARVLEPPALNRLLIACLQDLISSVIRLSGVSFTVAVPDPERAEDVRGVISAGVNVIAAATEVEGSALDRLIFRNAAERGFGRSVIVAGDTLAVPAATAGTAFGVLGSADLVVGPTHHAAWYLVGTRSATGVETILDANGRTDTLLERAAERGLIARRLEPRVRLAGISTLDELHAVRELPGLGPRVSAWLDEWFGE